MHHFLYNAVETFIFILRIILKILKMKDDLGDRMKSYEFSSRTYLGPRSYVVVRLDGKAFHSYTKGLERPFDEDFASDMNETAKFLCENLQGAQFAYVQSDEISIFLTTVGNVNAQPLFKNQIQKITSISAAMAAVKFYQLRLNRSVEKKYSEDGIYGVFEVINSKKLPFFDSRVMCFSDPYEVHNCFVWRQQDATRNSISMAAQSLFSHKELHKKSTNEMQDMMMTKRGVNWNDYPVRFKRGGFICKEKYEIKTSNGTAIRSRWSVVDPPIFTKDKEFTFSRIPTQFGPLYNIDQESKIKEENEEN